MTDTQEKCSQWTLEREEQITKLKCKKLTSTFSRDNENFIIDCCSQDGTHSMSLCLQNSVTLKHLG